MILKKALLIANGSKGLELMFDGYRKISDNFMSNYEDKRKDRLPVPLNLRMKFSDLKYFFLTMVGVWPEELTPVLKDYYSRVKTVDELVDDGMQKQAAGALAMEAESLFQKCRIIGYHIRGSEIKIVGTFENIEGKPYNPMLPFISEDDDYGFYHEAMAVIKEISNMVINYMKEENLELAEMKKLLLELQQNNPKDSERVEKQTDEENFIEYMKRLEDQALVFPIEGSQLEKDLALHSAKIVSKNTLDKSMFTKSEEIEDEQMVYETTPNGIGNNMAEAWKNHADTMADADMPPQELGEDDVKPLSFFEE